MIALLKPRHESSEVATIVIELERRRVCERLRSLYLFPNVITIRERAEKGASNEIFF